MVAPRPAAPRAARLACRPPLRASRRLGEGGGAAPDGGARRPRRGAAGAARRAGLAGSGRRPPRPRPCRPGAGAPRRGGVPQPRRHDHRPRPVALGRRGRAPRRGAGAGARPGRGRRHEGGRRHRLCGRRLPRRDADHRPGFPEHHPVRPRRRHRAGSRQPPGPRPGAGPPDAGRGRGGDRRRGAGERRRRPRRRRVPRGVRAPGGGSPAAHRARHEHRPAAGGAAARWRRPVPPRHPRRRHGRQPRRAGPGPGGNLRDGRPPSREGGYTVLAWQDLGRWLAGLALLPVLLLFRRSA